MLSAALQLIPYAVLATLSPLGFAATITVMQSGRLKALGFGVGVVVGQLLALTLLVVFGAAIAPDRSRPHPTLQALIEITLGVLLLIAASIVHRRPPKPRVPSSGRSQAALERLQRVHVLTATFLGLLLGIGGPKRLVLTALASASITAAGITGANEVALIGWYGLLATALVWVPILAYVLFGSWAVATIHSAQEWLAAHRRPATVVALAIVGAALLLDAARLLL